MMKTSIFVTFCLSLALGFSAIFAVFQHEFSGVEDYKAHVARLKKDVGRQHFVASLANEQLLEFRQEVATLIPKEQIKKLKGEKGYPVRKLATAVQEANPDRIRNRIATVVHERARKYFRNGSYRKAINLFDQVIEKYSFSVHLSEAYFLKSESLYQLKEYERCALTIQHMVRVMPESELTGFALLRLGNVFEKQSRVDEAIEIYETVLQSYPSREIASQAAKSIRAMEL